MPLKEVYRYTYTNAAAINATTTWYIRPSDEVQRMHGPFNLITVFNDADEDLKIIFNNDANDYVIVYSKTIYGTTLDDGKTYYTVDVNNTDTVTNVSIGEVKVRIARVKDVPGAV